MSAHKPLRDYAYDAAMLALGPLERTVVRSSLVPDTPFFDPAEFPFTRVLENGWRDIRAELDAVLASRNDLPAFQEISPDVSVIGDLNWKTYFFYGYGFKSEANCRRCPRTAALLEQVPGLTTAFFSILEPGVRIPPHRGPWKGVLRYHLGLLIPEPAEQCAIEVGGIRAHWREGGSLMFDDAYEHAAWNDTSQTRVVLFLDVLRPCRRVGSLVNRSVVKVVGLSPFVRDAKRRHEAWERRFEALHRN